MPQEGGVGRREGRIVCGRRRILLDGEAVERLVARRGICAVAHPQADHIGDRGRVLHE